MCLISRAALVITSALKDCTVLLESYCLQKRSKETTLSLIRSNTPPSIGFASSSVVVGMRNGSKNHRHMIEEFVSKHLSLK